MKIFSKFILLSGIDISRWFKASGQLGFNDLSDLYSKMVHGPILSQAPQFQETTSRKKSRISGAL